VRQLNGVYTQAFNRRHRKVGHVLQGRFKAILVDRDSYLLELFRYVVLNPARAKITKRPVPTAGQATKQPLVSMRRRPI
jgi:putative transposase